MTNGVHSRSIVVAADPQPVALKGVQQILLHANHLVLEATFEELEMATIHALNHPTNILLLDKGLGLQSILEAVSRIRDKAGLGVVVWGNTVTESEALRLLQAGVRGIARKTIDPATFIRCLETVAGGHTWMEDTVFREAARPDKAARSELTAREQQVAQLVQQGLKNKEIGGMLGIRPGTVKIHLKHIFEKTGVRGRYGLALTGLREKGVVPDLKM